MTHQKRIDFDPSDDPREQARRERTDAFYERYQRAKSERDANYFTPAAHREAERRCKQVKEAS